MASPFDPWRNTYGMPGPQDPNRPAELRASTAPRWEELFRGSDVTAINRNPLVQALQRYTNRAPSGIGEVTRVSPIDGRPVPPEPTALDNLPPTVQEGIGGLSLLANFLAPGAKLPPLAPKPQGIRAYHGSPHDFDRFDMSKIGTGEGAQAYGHGLYFAEAENVANNYRRALGNRKDVKFGGVTPSDNATVVLKRNDYDVDRSLDDLAQARKSAEGLRDTRLMQVLDRDIAEIQSLRGKPVELPGRMYEVSINADPERFLDWDKPLFLQSLGVKESLRKLGVDGVDNPRGMPSVTPSKNGDKWTVRNVWGEPVGTFATREAADYKAAEMLRSFGQGGAQLAYTKLGGNAVYNSLDRGAASSQLREAGIPGIRYKDALSRGADGGTSNYVVFDDSLIQILRKYGLLPPAAAAGASLMEQQEPPL